MTKKKDKEAKKLDAAVKAASSAKGISNKEESYIKALTEKAKKDGNVTKKELAAIKKEIKLQKNDKNSGVAAWKIEALNSGNNNQTTTVPTLPPPPPPPPSTIAASGYGAIKTPSKDTLNISSLIPQESAEKIKRLLFEELSAIELSIIERHDTIDGVRQQYAIISNLSEVRRRFNANKSLTNIEKGSQLSVYQIDLDSKIPNQSYLIQNGLTEEYSYLNEDNVEVSVEKGFLYIDSNGDLVIELNNMYIGEQIQIQIDSNGTIYEVTNLWLQILEKILLQNTF